MCRFSLVRLGLLLSFALPLQAAEPIKISRFDGDYVELFVEQVITLAYSRLGYKTIYLKLPPRRAIEFANSGGSDAELIRIEGLEERFPNLVMVKEPVTHIEIVAFSKNTSYAFKDWNSLANHSIAYLDGMILVEEAVKQFQAKGFSSMSKTLELVVNDRYDVAVLPRIDGLGYLRKEGWHTVVALEPPLATRPLYHYVNKKHQHLVALLDQELKAMKLSGEWQRLRDAFIAGLSQP